MRSRVWRQPKQLNSCAPAKAHNSGVYPIRLSELAGVCSGGRRLGGLPGDVCTVMATACGGGDGGAGDGGPGAAAAASGGSSSASAMLSGCCAAAAIRRSTGNLG